GCPRLGQECRVLGYIVWSLLSPQLHASDLSLPVETGIPKNRTSQAKDLLCCYLSTDANLYLPTRNNERPAMQLAKALSISARQGRGLTTIQSRNDQTRRLADSNQQPPSCGYRWHHLLLHMGCMHYRR